MNYLQQHKSEVALAELKLRLLPLTDREAKILMKIIRSSNPSIDEQQDTINIALKLEKLNEY